MARTGEKKQPCILLEDDKQMTWRDVNGVMWKYNKQTGNLYKFHSNAWNLVESGLKNFVDVGPDFVQPTNVAKWSSTTWL